MPKHLSIVSPVYNAENIMLELVKQIEANVKSITSNYEIILVNDGSKDRSWQKIQELCANNKKVIGINLSRNFGQHNTITAGLEHARGEWVVVMDCDLQDRPEEIPVLYNKATEGYDVVLAQRVRRNDSWLKRSGSKLFYKLFAYLTDIPQDESVANFGIYNGKVIAAVLKMREQTRMFPTMVKWVGFKKTSVPVTHGSRFEGESTYNFRNLFKLAIDTILTYSDKPLRLIIRIGFAIAAISFLFALWILLRYLTGHIVVLGYASLMISIWFLAGIMIMILGLLGLYMGKMFDGIKNRPIYLVDEIVNEEG